MQVRVRTEGKLNIDIECAARNRVIMLKSLYDDDENDDNKQGAQESMVVQCKQ